MKQQYTTEIVHAKCKPIFQHQYALASLKNEGYKMAVCSNSIRSSVELMMHKADLSQYLDFCVSNEDVTRGKPDPEMYELAIAKLGLRPDECLIVEDNEHGIKAAKASGARVMMVRTVEDVNYQNIRECISQVESSEEIAVTAMLASA